MTDGDTFEDEGQRAYSYAELATKHGVTTRTLRRWRASGRLRSAFSGGKYVVRLVENAPSQASQSSPEDRAPSAEGAAVVASFTSVAARSCRNPWARQRLTDATRAALEAAWCLQREEERRAAALAVGS